MATTFLRAVHTYIDDPPLLLDDRAAFDLLPAYQRRFILRLAALSSVWRKHYRKRHRLFTSMRAHIVVRARYAEDALARARVNGIGRYIILGAGLDTFALRQIAPRIEVVEIDHPGTQTWKRELFAKRHIDIPGSVQYIPVDFENESLADCWVASAAPDFISWLGVTYYLSLEAIEETLRVIAERVQPGSELVVDYWTTTPPSEAGGPLLRSTRLAVALLNEPMHSFFEPNELEALAVAAGWRIREHCPPAQQAERYLTTREDRLSVPSFAHLLHLER